MSRIVNIFGDGVADGTAVYASANANFDSGDVDKIIYGDNILQPTTIIALIDSVHIRLSNAVPAGSRLAFTIASVLPIMVEGGKLPLNYEPTPLQYQSALGSRLRVKVSGDNVILGSTQANEPSYNVGPWLPGPSWRTWSDSVAIYNATIVLSVGIFTQTISATPTANRTQYLPDANGTIAYLLDVRVPRATTLLATGTTPVIDWSTSSSFLGRLSSNISPTFSNPVQGSKIMVSLINNGTPYTVTWPGGIHWNGAHAQPVATAGIAVAGLYVFRCVGPSLDIYGSYTGPYNLSSHGALEAPIGGPDSQPSDYGEPHGTNLGPHQVQIP